MSLRHLTENPRDAARKIVSEGHYYPTANALLDGARTIDEYVIRLGIVLFFKIDYTDCWPLHN